MGRRRLGGCDGCTVSKHRVECICLRFPLPAINEGVGVEVRGEFVGGERGREGKKVRD